MSPKSTRDTGSWANRKEGDTLALLTQKTVFRTMVDVDG